MRTNCAGHCAASAWSWSPGPRSRACLRAVCSGLRHYARLGVVCGALSASGPQLVRQRRLQHLHTSAMSWFFTTGLDGESELSLSGEDLVTKPVRGNYGKQPLLLSEDEEDTKRAVRSAKGKRFEELTHLVCTIRNARKIRDVTKCLEESELLGKAYGKTKSTVDREGVPRLYIRILADLEDYLREKYMGRPRAPWTKKVPPGSISASWLTSRTISGKSIWEDQEHRGQRRCPPALYPHLG
ncbi:hypothetical protein P7K49_018778 [Saguinus oedipus]|uniref:Eukaryotic translation initiation factor 3 subunit C N-terminal domain-containing protein n=1 Tax=Saguinus oedipus TaxID=9490 RepID=A0ABQ9V6T3_SAGOE|nr:hypothetical protein P7K49_018778 [Saguinus oedipus]